MALHGLVRDYMIEDVTTVRPEDDVLKAIETIVKGMDQLPVINDKGQLAGIITWRDIAEKVILKNQIPKDVKVKEIMETDIITLSPKDPVRKALELLTDRKFSLPVVKSRKLIGLLSFMDVLKPYLDVVRTLDLRDNE